MHLGKYHLFKLIQLNHQFQSLLHRRAVRYSTNTYKVAIHSRELAIQKPQGEASSELIPFTMNSGRSRDTRVGALERHSRVQDALESVRGALEGVRGILKSSGRSRERPDSLDSVRHALESFQESFVSVLNFLAQAGWLLWGFFDAEKS